jgi:hypothetical protein
MGENSGLDTPPAPFELLDVEDVLKKLTKKEKVDLTAGKTIHFKTLILFTNIITNLKLF